MKSLRHRQGGFMLISMVVTIGLMAALSPVISSGISQIFRSTNQAKATLGAVQDMQISTQWLRLDVSRASSVTVSGGAVATFDWLDTDLVPRSCTYSLSGTLLQRQCAAAVTTVGRNISSVLFTVVGDTVRIDLTSTPAGTPPVSTSRTVTFYMRTS